MCPRPFLNGYHCRKRLKPLSTFPGSYHLSTPNPLDNILPLDSFHIVKRLNVENVLQDCFSQSTLHTSMPFCSASVRRRYPELFQLPRQILGTCELDGRHSGTLRVGNVFIPVVNEEAVTWGD